MGGCIKCIAQHHFCGITYIASLTHSEKSLVNIKNEERESHNLGLKYVSLLKSREREEFEHYLFHLWTLF